MGVICLGGGGQGVRVLEWWWTRASKRPTHPHANSPAAAACTRTHTHTAHTQPTPPTSTWPHTHTAHTRPTHSPRTHAPLGAHPPKHTHTQPTHTLHTHAPLGACRAGAACRRRACRPASRCRARGSAAGRACSRAPRATLVGWVVCSARALGVGCWGRRRAAAGGRRNLEAQTACAARTRARARARTRKAARAFLITSLSLITQQRTQHTQHSTAQHSTR